MFLLVTLDKAGHGTDFQRVFKKGAQNPVAYVKVPV